MTEKSKHNVLVCDFMGYQKKNHSTYIIPQFAYDENDDGQITRVEEFSIFFDDMEFNRSWNWLMPVALKCVKVAEDMQADEWVSGIQMSVASYGSTIDTAYKEVVDFIEWYNNNK